MKKHIAFITALVLSVGLLASCAKETGGTGGTSGGTGGTSAAARSEFTYVPQYVELPSDVAQMAKPLMLDGVMYFLADVTIGSETVTMAEGGGSYDVDITEQRLYAMNADGTNYRRLSAFAQGEIPETAEAGANWTVDKMIAADDASLWLYESGNFGYSDENGVYFDDTRSVLRRVSTSDGAELAAIDLTTLGEVAEEETGGALPEGAGARPAGTQGGGAMSSAMASMPGGGGNVMGALRSMGISLGFGNAYLRADAKGDLYVGDGMGSVRIFSADGTEKSTVELPQTVMMQDLINLPNGDVAVIYRDMSGVHVVAVDADAAALGAEFCVYNGSYNGVTYAGIADDGVSLLFYSSTGMFSVGADGKEKQLINWLESDVDANGIFVLGSPDGESILCMTGIQNDSFTTQMGRGTMSISFAGFGGGTTVPLEMLRLVKTPTADLPQRTELTLAVITLDQNLRAEVLRFNKRSQDYRIRVVDYSELGMDKLNTDIIMGNVPDIILADGLPISTYVERGILEDLFPYLDADTALGGRAAIMPAFLNALATGDALYRISSGFTVNTLAGNADLLGSGNGWTMDELNAVVAANPDSFLLPEDFDRATVLYRILSNNLDEYIDPVTGECKFNTPEFIKLMELLRDNFSEATAPSTTTGPNAGYGGGGVTTSAAPAMRIRLNETVELMSGKQLLQSTTLRGFDSLMQSNVQANGNPVFKGYPSAERNGNAFDTTLTLAMSSTCADKAGAWEFMRGILTSEYQTSNGGRGFTGGFPSNNSVFMEQAAEAMTEATEQETTMVLASTVGILNSDGGKDTDGDGVADIYPKGMLMGGEMTFIYYYAMTEAEFNRYMDFFNSITRVAEGSEKVVEIVSEELEAFFAGQKTAEATATVIQSRVRLFTDEQR